jgi:hypothetical protein
VVQKLGPVTGENEFKFDTDKRHFDIRNLLVNRWFLGSVPSRGLFDSTTGLERWR